MRIKDLCESERPREKLLKNGPESLDDVELIAIILRTGTAKEGAIDLSRRLVKTVGERLSGLAEISASGLATLPGIGPGKAAAISASFELGRRLLKETPNKEKITVNAPELVYRLMIPYMRGLKHEECWAMFLSTSLYLLEIRKLSYGGLNGTTFDVKEIVRGALQTHAYGVILIHNHPSGNPLPGQMDIECTGNLRNALQSFELKLVEHLVFCDDGYYSFAEERSNSIPCAAAP